MSEIPLVGGNASAQVLRIGDTVRKSWRFSSPSTQRFAQHVIDCGIDVARPLGRDEQGRQSQEFVPGMLAIDAPPLDLDDLARVGDMVRKIHEASTSFVQEPGDHWDSLIPAPGHELVCHNDLAPWNLVVGDRWVFIDWDGSAPSTRLWDLAYAAQAFTLNTLSVSPEESAMRLSAFVDGYGADRSLREALPRAMWKRTQAMYSILEQAHAEDRQPWGNMFVADHGEHWGGATRYVKEHETVWRNALSCG